MKPALDSHPDPVAAGEELLWEVRLQVEHRELRLDSGVVRDLRQSEMPVSWNRCCAVSSHFFLSGYLHSPKTSG